jgi:hypothetical protein
MRVILYTNKQTGEVEIFSSLKPFFDKYHENLLLMAKFNAIVNKAIAN